MRGVDRVVFDCNIFAQTLITPHGNAGRCVERVLDGRIRLFWSHYVLQEIRAIPQKRTPKRLGIAPEHVESLIARLAPIAHLISDPPSAYRHPIDPKDSHYVDLAVASNAALIVSRDKHLLNLMDISRPDAQQFNASFPTLAVLQPEALLELFRKSLADPLQDIEGLLRSHGHFGQADYVKQLLDLPTRNRTELISFIQTVEMWGGAGAVWEVGDLKTDTLIYREAIIRLAAAMDRDGIGTDRSRHVASILSDWNQRGV